MRRTLSPWHPRLCRFAFSLAAAGLKPYFGLTEISPSVISKHPRRFVSIFVSIYVFPLMHTYLRRAVYTFAVASALSPWYVHFRPSTLELSPRHRTSSAVSLLRLRHLHFRPHFSHFHCGARAFARVGRTIARCAAARSAQAERLDHSGVDNAKEQMPEIKTMPLGHLRPSPENRPAGGISLPRHYCWAGRRLLSFMPAKAICAREAHGARRI